MGVSGAGENATCKAFAAHDASGVFSEIELQRRALLADDVSISILYSGVCHSDAHTVLSEWGPIPYPMVPGHEIVGRVDAVGSAVTKFKVGDIGAVGTFVDQCDSCEFCKNDLTALCTQMTATYNSKSRREGEPECCKITQGGYASKIVTREANVFQVPEALLPQLEKVAPLLCAGITTYFPIVHYVGEDLTGLHVGVMGFGGLGHLAIKFAKAMGARVTVFSRSEQKRAGAMECGADEYVASADDAQMKPKARSVDVMINTVPFLIDLNPYFALVKKNGKFIQLSVPEKPMSIHMGMIVMNQLQFCGSLVGGLKVTEKMLALCAEKNIVPMCEVVEVGRVNEAFKRMIAGDVKYRFVLDLTKWTD
ncbi:NADP-dependent alcohol dehydrogenase C 2 [Porphyridium purpureum]|uniref:NADP-dependent alcohol dehydrogenase C 2 n=1 Tax=Porphyridium purpureum TaxID=35688 RepID=A0A5J4YKV8_PORPP|nr:NADP-dependent alcohol dehydrogenase C 2 [Porphyridium purpureum]|eukprot:POR9774..scf249_10